MVVIVKKPKAIVMDLTGVMATKAFMSYSNESKTFMRTNIGTYIEDCWGSKNLRMDVNYLRQAQAEEVKAGKNSPALKSMRDPADEQAQSVITYVLWSLDSEPEGLPSSLALFHLHMSEWGYQKGLLSTP